MLKKLDGFIIIEEKPDYNQQLNWMCCRKEESMDIRSRKTRQTIAKCFPELLRKTPVSKITVTEICAMAKINRAAYFKHYLDIPDLQEALENEMLYQFREFLQSRAFSDNGTYRAMLIEFFRLRGSSAEAIARCAPQTLLRTGRQEPFSCRTRWRFPYYSRSFRQ